MYLRRFVVVAVKQNKKVKEGAGRGWMMMGNKSPVKHRGKRKR